MVTGSSITRCGQPHVLFRCASGRGGGGFIIVRRRCTLALQPRKIPVTDRVAALGGLHGSHHPPRPTTRAGAALGALGDATLSAIWSLSGRKADVGLTPVFG